MKTPFPLILMLAALKLCGDSLTYDDLGRLLQRVNDTVTVRPGGRPLLQHGAPVGVMVLRVTHGPTLLGNGFFRFR